MSAQPQTPSTSHRPFGSRRKSSTTLVALDPPAEPAALDEDPEVLAARIAAGLLDRRGAPLPEHLERVAGAVPAQARLVALLHEALERGTATVAELEFAGLSETEVAALRLLARAPEDSYELHLLNVVHAPGPEGELARVVAAADLDDHLANDAEGARNTAPYRWARRHLDIALDRAPSAPAHP